MKNETYKEALATSPNTNIHTIFHIETQKNSEALYDLVRRFEMYEIKNLLPNVKASKIQKAIKKNDVINFLADNGVTGFLAEVYHKRIIGVNGDKYEFDLTRQHITIMHDENYQNLVKRILERSEYYLKDDIEKLKRKKEDGLKNNTEV